MPPFKKAMILAAGLGTRLRPLTNDRPKALVTIAGRTMLEIALARLRHFGVNEVIINTHHFAEKISQYLVANGNFGMRIELGAPRYAHIHVCHSHQHANSAIG